LEAEPVSIGRGCKGRDDPPGWAAETPREACRGGRKHEENPGGTPKCTEKTLARVIPGLPSGRGGKPFGKLECWRENCVRSACIAVITGAREVAGEGEVCMSCRARGKGKKGLKKVNSANRLKVAKEIAKGTPY